MDVAKRYQDNLPRIKKAVKNGHDYFRHNYDRYNEFRRFVFESNLTGDEITLLESRGMPQLEFNILEAYISRLLGEMSKQEPDIEVNADNQEDADPLTIRIVQEHLRHVMLDINNEHTRYEIYKDILSGGFGVLKVFTDYENPMSMNQAIMIERCEPTLCVFDKITKFSHKGDGRFCAQLFPKAKEDFEDEYPDVQLNTVSFRRDFAGFSWSYLNDNSEIVLLADYYEKKKKEQTIVQVRDGKVMTMEKYNRMVEEWNDITVPPAIIGKPRKTMRENIVRYTLIENQVLKYEETDFEQLPLVFVDGNSALIKTPKNGNIRQVTRPYVYHAKGAQRLLKTKCNQSSWLLKKRYRKKRNSCRPTRTNNMRLRLYLTRFTKKIQRCLSAILSVRFSASRRLRKSYKRLQVQTVLSRGFWEVMMLALASIIINYLVLQSLKALPNPIVQRCLMWLDTYRAGSA